MRLSLLVFLHVMVILILLIVNPHARNEDDGWTVIKNSSGHIYLNNKNT